MTPAPQSIERLTARPLLGQIRPTGPSGRAMRSPVGTKHLLLAGTFEFSDAFRLKTKLNKEINFFGTQWNKSFYGILKENKTSKKVKK